MNRLNVYDITLSKIYIFICCAESGSFTEAAVKLNFTQSMVSKTIRSLEDELGLSLFDRGKKGCRLTEAGALLWQEWKKALDILGGSIEKAQSLRYQTDHELHLCNMNSVTDDSLFVETLDQFRKRYPQVSLKTMCLSLDEILEAVSKNDFDIIFTARFDADNLEKLGYQWMKVQDTYVTLFISDLNPLYGRKQLSLEDLREESFLSLTNENYIGHLKEMCEPYGFSPKIRMYVKSPLSFEANLLATDSVVLADSNTCISNPRIHRYVQKDIPCDEIVAWRSVPQKPYVDLFIELVKNRRIPEWNG